MGQGGFPDPIGDGAMWARQTKNGVEYFSGNLSSFSGGSPDQGSICGIRKQPEAIREGS